MIAKLVLSCAMAVAVFAGESAAQKDCHGCGLSAAYWDHDGSWLGSSQVVPGVSLEFQWGPSTDSGQCQDPDCVPVPCTFGSGKFTISNDAAGGRIRLTNPGDVPLVEFAEGQEGSVPVEGSGDGGQESIACGAAPVRLLKLRHPNGTVYAIGIVCSICN